jgi:hypothetical protein
MKKAVYMKKIIYNYKLKNMKRVHFFFIKIVHKNIFNRENLYGKKLIFIKIL